MSIQLNSANNTLIAPVVDSAQTRTRSAFSAYLSASFGTAKTSTQIVPFDLKEFDELSEFDTTNSQFTANATGYYFFSAGLTSGATSTSGDTEILLYKNANTIFSTTDPSTGTLVAQGQQVGVKNSTAVNPTLLVNVVTNLNTGDNVSIWTTGGSAFGSITIDNANSNTWFTGVRVM